MTAICTEDGTGLVHDPKTGLSASGRTREEAEAELRRLMAARAA